MTQDWRADRDVLLAAGGVGRPDPVSAQWFQAPPRPPRWMTARWVPARVRDRLVRGVYGGRMEDHRWTADDTVRRHMDNMWRHMDTAGLVEWSGSGLSLTAMLRQGAPTDILVLDRLIAPWRGQEFWGEYGLGVDDRFVPWPAPPLIEKVMVSLDEQLLCYWGIVPAACETVIPANVRSDPDLVRAWGVREMESRWVDVVERGVEYQKEVQGDAYQPGILDQVVSQEWRDRASPGDLMRAWCDPMITTSAREVVWLVMQRGYRVWDLPRVSDPGEMDVDYRVRPPVVDPNLVTRLGTARDLSDLYRVLVAAPGFVELTMGVTGSTPEANQLRYDVANRLIQASLRDDYPDLAPLTFPWLVRQARGDLSQVDRFTLADLVYTDTDIDLRIPPDHVLGFADDMLAKARHVNLPDSPFLVNAGVLPRLMQFVEDTDSARVAVSLGVPGTTPQANEHRLGVARLLAEYMAETQDGIPLRVAREVVDTVIRADGDLCRVTYPGAEGNPVSVFRDDALRFAQSPLSGEYTDLWDDWAQVGVDRLVLPGTLVAAEFRMEDGVVPGLVLPDAGVYRLTPGDRDELDTSQRPAPDPVGVGGPVCAGI